MVRASKSTSSSVSAPVSTPATAPVVAEASTASASKPRAKKPKTEAASAAPTPVVAAPVLTNELSTTPATTTAVDVSNLSVRMTEFSAKLQQMIGLFSTVKNDFKTLEKAVAREMKIAQKASSKKRRNNGNRKPSGFIKPTRISDELAEFLGKTIGTEMARTEVSKEINAYIHTNSLQDKSNGRKIHPDEKLTKLLKIKQDDELTYFNLQRYMKHHFIKAVVEGAVATA